MADKQWHGHSPSGSDDDFEEVYSSELTKIEQQKRLYEKRIVDSTERSVRRVVEAQQTAGKTEEELARQEESLSRTETNLDKIHSDLNITNRHLKSLKSVWGSLGNYFSKSAPSSDSSLASNQRDTVKARPIVTGSSSKQATSLSPEKASLPLSKDPNAIVDKNLDLMFNGLTDLKQHALLMGHTLDRHNETLDRVTYKAAGADEKLLESDRKIKKILK